jgi:glutathione S-transferase
MERHSNMYELFIANKNYSSWSLRPWVLMRELSIPFTETIIPFCNAPDGTSIADVSPSGRVPCLRDGQLRVWDSLSIVEYLAERHEHVWPSDATARAWARSAAAEMHSGFFELREKCTMSCGIRARLGEIAAPLALELERLDALWLEGLEKFGGPFLAGPQFTAVDAFFAPVAFRVQSYGLQLKPAALQYVSRLLQLASMRDWYAAALQEPWRHEQYEAAVRDILIEDRRVQHGS